MQIRTHVYIHPQCFWSCHATEHFPLLFTASVLHYFRELLLQYNNFEQLMQVMTTDYCISDALHHFISMRAVFPEPPGKDTTDSDTLTSNSSLGAPEI